MLTTVTFLVLLCLTAALSPVKTAHIVSDAAVVDSHTSELQKARVPSW